MATTNKKLADELNKLIEINNDRVKGYETALKETDESDLKDVLREMAIHSSNFNTELTNEMINLGEKPTEGTKTTGKIYRKWMGMKAALTNRDRKGILSSCEYGEDVALEAYEDVLKSNAPFSAKIHDLIVSQKQKLKKDHDRIKGLRDLSIAMQRNHS